MMSQDHPCALGSLLHGAVWEPGLPLSVHRGRMALVRGGALWERPQLCSDAYTRKAPDLADSFQNKSSARRCSENLLLLTHVK